MKTPARHLASLGLAMLVATATAGSALARADTRNMTCEQTQRLIIRSGAVVLSTGAHTYDRYVAGGSFCPRPYEPVPTWVPTKDLAQCPVYNCQQVDELFWGR